MTLDEIAMKCGVSKSTVSRALSGKGRIGKETRDRIKSFVRDNGMPEYREDIGTGRLKTGNIGVVIPADAYSTSIPFFQECLLGISEAAASEGYDVLITTGTATDYSGVRQLVENNKVDGVILMRISKFDLTLEYLTEQNICVGLAGQCDNPNIIQAGSDNLEASRSLTSRLIDCGYRRFAIIVGNPEYRVNCDRIEGFNQALNHYGLRTDEQMLVKDFKISSYIDTLIQDIFSGRIECIICGDDLIGSRIMSSLQAGGYRIPLDIGVASLCNGATLDCFIPSVTTVNIQARRQGLTVGKQLVRCIKGESYSPQTALEFEILLRGSVAMNKLR